MKILNILITAVSCQFIIGCSSTYEPTNPTHDIIGLSLIEEYEPKQPQSLKNLEEKNVVLLFEGDTSTTPTGGGLASINHPPAVKYLIPNPGEVLFINVYERIFEVTKNAKCSFIGTTTESVKNAFTNNKPIIIISISLTHFESNVIGIKNKSNTGNYILSKATCQIKATEYNGTILFDELITTKVKCKFGKPVFNFLANQILFEIDKNINI